MSEPILVLGMHRSGTSAVAGVLSKLGGRAPKNLMPAAPWNERGFFESTPMMALNDELLASAGSSWDDWRRFTLSWFDSGEAVAFRRRAKDLFESEFEGSSLPVLKDPRICRFAPFWLQLLKETGRKPRVVIPIRSPLEVAQSLHEIFKMPLEKGLLLWLRHVLDAEADSRNEPRSIFSWDQFLSDWRSTVEKIGVQANIAWPRLSDRVGLEIERFLGRELVHQRVSPSDLVSHSKVHQWTLAAYDALLELARNPFSNSSLEKLTEIKELFDVACAMFGPALVGVELEAEELRKRLARHSEERDRLHSQTADLQASLDAMRERAADLSGQLERAAAALAEAERERETVAAALMRAEAEASRLSNELGQISTEKDRLAHALDEREARLATAAAALAETARAREELSSSVAMMKEGLTEADARLSDLSKQLRAARADHDRISAEAKEATDARRKAEEAAAQQSALRAADAAALAANEKRAGAQIQALTGRLVDAEARLAKAERRSNGAGWRRVFPRGRRRAEARLLLKSGLFDEEWYTSKYPDALKNGRSAIDHFLEEGYLCGNRPNSLFDPLWYLEHYEDVRRSGMNPVVHYILHGAGEGRDPGPDFNTKFYLSANSDVRDKTVNPLAHYLSHGRHEGRRAVPRR